MCSLYINLKVNFGSSNITREKVNDKQVNLFIFFQFLKLLYCCSITVVCIFSSPLHPTPARPSSLPLGFVHVSFIVVPENPSPHYPFPPPFWLLKRHKKYLNYTINQLELAGVYRTLHQMAEYTFFTFFNYIWNLHQDIFHSGL